MSEKVTCDLCKALLHNGQTMDVHLSDDTRELYTYLMALSRGGLLVATDTLIVTLARCRHIFKQLTLRDEFLKAGDQLDQLIECAAQLLFQRESHESLLLFADMLTLFFITSSCWYCLAMHLISSLFVV